MDDREASGNRPKTIEGASMIVLRRNAVLMVERSREPSKGLWSFPAGRAEPGEDPETNARRELLEETGLAVGPVIWLGEFRPTLASSPFHINVFAARAGAGQPRAGDDAAQAEFVPFSAVLTRPLTPGAAGWIARAIGALSGLAPP
jgi:ADP-ribose pyrophosphatase YjhB (NUDIX family)